MCDESTSENGSSGQLCTNCEKIVLKAEWLESKIVDDEHDEAHNVATAPYTRIETGLHGNDEFPALPGLLDSSRQGCTFCKFLKDILSSNEASAALENPGHSLSTASSISIQYSVSFMWNCTYSTEHQYLVLNVCFPHGYPDLELYCTIQNSEGCKASASWLDSSQPTHNLYTQKETVAWMRSKLNNCVEWHGCGADMSKSSSYLPERLLDVRGDIPKLVLRADIHSSSQANPRYLALSYCWGKEGDVPHQPKAELTRKSIHGLQTGSGEQELSTVHRDAVSVAKALHIPYIWIDALCILQDDHNDWERQCEQMDKIYGCAHATILAAASASSHESFLRRPRGLQTVIPFRSVGQLSRNGSLQIELRKVTSWTDIKEPDDLLQDDLELSRLSTRGWAYQESVLSTRRIIFGEWGIHYLCSESHQTMNGPECGSHFDTTMDLLKHYLSRGDFNIAWKIVFEDATRFGNCSFSYPKDILPALSGLVRVFQEYCPDTYLAGHWEQRLFLNLAWQRGVRTPKTKEVHFQDTLESEPYTVPSWSILCKGYVEFIDGHSSSTSVTSEVQSCVGRVALTGKDPFGTIQNARLEIRTKSFQNHTTFDQSISVEQINEFIWTNIWSVVIDWDSRHFQFIVHLDYHLQASEIEQDPRMWRWILLGSIKYPTRDKSSTSSTSDNQSHLSQPEWRDVGKASESDIDYVSGYDEESENGSSEASVSRQSVGSAYSSNVETKERRGLHHDKGDQRHELDPTINQNAQYLSDAWETEDPEEADAEGDTELESYAYGLLLLQVPDRQEWCRVGVFSPRASLLRQEREFRPELELMPTSVFKEMSHIESMTVI